MIAKVQYRPIAHRKVLKAKEVEKIKTVCVKMVVKRRVEVKVVVVNQTRAGHRLQKISRRRLRKLVRVARAVRAHRGLAPMRTRVNQRLKILKSRQTIRNLIRRNRSLGSRLSPDSLKSLASLGKKAHQAAVQVARLAHLLEVLPLVAQVRVAALKRR